MSAPRLSVITINRNNADGLDRTLASLFSQTYADFESIVIDGKSSDASVQVIKKYTDRIRIWKSEPDSGIYNAMNKGTRLATGEYCLYLNSGDYLFSETVLAEIFSGKPEADIVYFDLMIDYGDKMILGKMPEHVDYEIFVRRQVWHQSLLKRNLFERFGMYDESFRLLGDYEFLLRTIVVHNVSRKYMPITIAVFNTEGLGSRPENKTLATRERKRAQRMHLNTWDLIWRFNLEHKAGRLIAQLPLGKQIVGVYKRLRSAIGHK